MSDIDAYVRQQAAQITPAVVEELLPKLPFLRMEFTQIKAPEFPELFEQLEFLAEVVEDFAEKADPRIPYATVAGAVFALLYVHRHLDLLPGRADAVGHADDSSVVRSVLKDHQAALAAYAARHQVAWAGLPATT